MKALLTFLAGMACLLALSSHTPKRQWRGWRCDKCGKPAATEGELLGLDDEARTHIQ